MTAATYPPGRPLTLQTSYADTGADQLGFSLDAPLQEALAVVDHCFLNRRFGHVDLSLRILGASHQVLVDAGPRHLRETVACLPEIDTALPSAFRDSATSSPPG